MIEDNWRRYEVSPEISETSIGGETVLLHLVSGQYFGLDNQSTVIWNYIKAGKSLHDVVGILTSEQGVAEATVSTDLHEFMSKLVENEILVLRGKKG